MIFAVIAKTLYVTLTPFIQYEIFHPVLGSDGPLYLLYLECMFKIYKFNFGKTDFVRQIV